MPTFRRFDEIEAWQKARELTKVVYKLSGRGPFAKDFGLRDQIRRSSVSIHGEYCGRVRARWDREIRTILAVAKSSAAEVLSHAYVALDQDFISREGL